MPSEVQSGQQLNPSGLATSPHRLVRPPDPGSAQGEGSDVRFFKEIMSGVVGRFRLPEPVFRVGTAVPVL